jgi:hypothetical protein
MTMQGVYRKWTGTLPPSLVASATVDALRATCELALSKLDSVEAPRGFRGATEITQTTQRSLKVFFGCTEGSIFKSSGCHEYDLPSFSEGEFRS